MKRMKILATLLATIACALPAAAQDDETAKSFHLLPHLADGGGVAICPVGHECFAVSEPLYLQRVRCSVEQVQ